MARLNYSVSTGRAHDRRGMDFYGSNVIVMSKGAIVEIDTAAQTATERYSNFNSGGHGVEVHNGVAYFGTLEAPDPTLYAYDLDADTLNWEVSAGGIIAFPKVDTARGLVYITNRNDPSTFDAYNIADGSLAWGDAYASGTEEGRSKIAIGNNRAFFITDESRIVAMDLMNQQVDWTDQPSTDLLQDPRGCLYDGGKVYTGDNSFLYQYDETGTTPDWSFNPTNGTGVFGGVTPDGQGNYWYSNSSQLTKMDPSGPSELYGVNAGTPWQTEILVDDQGHITFSGFDGSYIKDDDRLSGSVVWQFSDGGNFGDIAFDTLRDGNLLYTADSVGDFYALNNVEQVVSGTVTDVNNNAVEGATVTAIDEGTDEVLGTATTAADGTYQIVVGTENTVHITCEYTDANGDLHSKSLPFVTPVTPS